MICCDEVWQESDGVQCTSARLWPHHSQCCSEAHLHRRRSSAGRRRSAEGDSCLYKSGSQSAQSAQCNCQHRCWITSVREPQHLLLSLLTLSYFDLIPDSGLLPFLGWLHYTSCIVKQLRLSEMKLLITLIEHFTFYTYFIVIVTDNMEISQIVVIHHEVI